VRAARNIDGPASVCHDVTAYVCAGQRHHGGLALGVLAGRGRVVDEQGQAIAEEQAGGKRAALDGLL